MHIICILNFRALSLNAETSIQNSTQTRQCALSMIGMKKISSILDLILIHQRQRIFGD